MAKEFIKRFLPDRDTLARNRMLRWLGPTLLHPDLWHVGRRSIAIGLAIGLFFGLMIPLAQIPAAVFVAMVFRANLAVAAAGTFITNPFTFGPIYFLAYQIGDALIGEPQTIVPDVAAAAAQELVSGRGQWILRVADMGAPLFLGLFLLAVTASITAYVGVHLAWRMGVVTKKRRRQSQRADQENR